MTIWAPSLDPSKPKHQAIVDALTDDIASGRLVEGARLPTHRDLADALDVSLGTVTRAILAATRRGLVHGEVGRGTFVGGPVSGRFVLSGTESPIDLGPTWPLYCEDPDIGPTLREIARDPERAELLRYPPNAGFHRHREAGAAWASRLGIEADPRRVLVCAGVQHAMLVALSALAEPGDTVLAEETTYPGFKAVAHLLRLRVVGLPMDENGLLPDAFAAACSRKRPKALYSVPTLHNPTTSTLPVERRRRIAEIARERGVPILEDEVQHLLATRPPPPIARFAPDMTYLIAGISKVVSGALRVAYLVAPEPSVEQLERRIWATAWMASPLSAEVATRWILDGTADATARRKKAEGTRRVALAKRILAGTDLRAEPAAYHAWLQLPPRWEAAEFTNAAQQSGVTVMPIETFAVRPPEGRRAVRLSLSSPWDRATLERGLRRLRELLSASTDSARPMV